jgi:hypothetical protein
MVRSSKPRCRRAVLARENGECADCSEPFGACSWNQVIYAELRREIGPSCRPEAGGRAWRLSIRPVAVAQCTEGCELEDSHVGFGRRRRQLSMDDASTPDDVHLLIDLHAVIQPDVDGTGHGGKAAPVLISSLRPTARLVLLSVSLGDRAVVVDRACGCPLEGSGWTTHFQTIRSGEEITAGEEMLATFLGRLCRRARCLSSLSPAAMCRRP